MERSAERLRVSNDTLQQACDRHHEAYKVAERERVALVKRSHNQRVEIGRLIEQLTAATARAEAAESLVAGLRGALEEARKDNEELDGTDAAHPAWWRGNDAGVAQVCAQINAILDGADVFGTASEPWESTRRRVAEARKDSERLREVLEAGKADRWAATVGNTETNAFRPSGWVVRAEAALALTPASAGAWLKAEALREAAKAASVHNGAKHWEFDEVHDFLLHEADRLTAEAEKEGKI